MNEMIERRKMENKLAEYEITDPLDTVVVVLNGRRWFLIRSDEPARRLTWVSLDKDDEYLMAGTLDRAFELSQ